MAMSRKTEQTLKESIEKAISDTALRSTMNGFKYAVEVVLNLLEDDNFTKQDVYNYLIGECDKVNDVLATMNKEEEEEIEKDA